MRIWNLLPLIGIIIFVYIIIDIGIEKIGHSLLLISPFYFFIALLFIVPRVVLSSYKWLLISKKQKLNVIFHIRMIMTLILKRNEEDCLL